MSRNKAYRLPDYLEHILEACRKIKRFTADLSEHEFFLNELVQDAVVRNIEIIGEAVINIRRDFPEFLTANPVLPWGDICDMRNRLAHGYMSIDLKLVWNVVARDIPVLQEQVQELHWRLQREVNPQAPEQGSTPSP